MTQVIVRRLPSRNNELYHHGVEGQKWGVRRYQNPDGSLTAAGYKHYGLTPRRRKYVDSEGVLTDTSKNRYIKKALQDSESRYVNAEYRKNEKLNYIDKNKNNPKKKEKVKAAKVAAKEFSKEAGKAESTTWKNIAKAIEANKDVTIEQLGKKYRIKGKAVSNALKSVGLSVALSAVATGLLAGKMDMHGRQITGVTVLSKVTEKALGNKYKVKDQADPTTNRVTLTSKPWVTDKSIIKSQTERVNNSNAYEKSKAKTPVVKKQPVKKQPAKQQTTSASKGLSWEDSYKVTKVSDVPKSAKLQFDKHDGVTEVSWLTNDGHIAYGEYDPKTKKIFDVNING